MKKLEELGISPAPWEAGTNRAFTTLLDGYKGKVIYANGDVNKIPYVGFANVHNGDVDAAIRNALLISAAPELYEALYEATYEYCHACQDGHGNCQKRDGDCFVQKWRAALAKAAGESEVRQ